MPPRVIGIGEHAHGELLSWGPRLEAVRAVGRDKVVVLLDNLDYYVSGFRRRPVRFETNPDGSFMPHMAAFGDRTAEHLEVCRAFAGLHVPCYGIDVQALNFPHMMQQRGLVGRALAEHRAAWEGATAAERKAGGLRNRLNAETILWFARRFPRRTVLYFAQNEHVALACDNSRRDPGYVTEGAVLRSALGAGGYLSVATFAPTLWCMWGSVRPRLHVSAWGKDYGRSDFDEVVEFTGPGPKPHVLGIHARGRAA